MTTRWGHDQEERAAIARKAHDSYNIARQAMEKINQLEGQIAALREEQAATDGTIAGLQRRIAILEREPVDGMTKKGAGLRPVRAA